MSEYRDIDNNPVSLLKLIKTEPEWAESRITFMEKRIKELEKVYPFLYSENQRLTDGIKRIIGEIRAEIETRSEHANIGKKGCLNRLVNLLEGK